jgi:hypothetical protein
MTFSRVNPGGWAMYEVLTSSQMNTLDINMTNALDGAAGGTYTPTATLELDGSAGLFDTLKVKAGGPGAAIWGIASSGHGMIVESDTTSPARSALRIIPQDTDPINGLAGDVFFDNSDDINRMRVYDGDAWNNAGAIEVAMAQASTWLSPDFTGFSAWGNESFEGVAFGWDKSASTPLLYWVAVGSTTASNGPICGVSQDGQIWEDHTGIGVKNISLNGIIWDGTLNSGNAYFVAVGAHDGTDAYILIKTGDPTGSWTEQSNPISAAGLRDIATDGSGTLVAVGDANAGDANIARSTADPPSWSEISNSLNDNLYRVCYGGGQFVAVGGASAPKILTSTDGSSWTSQTPAVGTVDGLRGVCYNEKIGKYIAVGGDEIQVSSNGSSWTKLTHDAGTGVEFFAVSAEPITGVTVISMSYSSQSSMLVTPFLADDPTFYKLPSPASPTINAGIVFYDIKYNSSGQFVGVGGGGGAANYAWAGCSGLMRGLDLSEWT